MPPHYQQSLQPVEVVDYLEEEEVNKLQTYCDGRFNMVVHFYTPYDQTVDRWQTSPTNCN